MEELKMAIDGNTFLNTSLDELKKEPRGAVGRSTIYCGGPSEAVMLRLIEECTGDELAEILRAWNGQPEPERRVFSVSPSSPWPAVAFWIAAGAVLCTWIVMHPEWHW